MLGICTVSSHFVHLDDHSIIHKATNSRSQHDRHARVTRDWWLSKDTSNSFVTPRIIRIIQPIKITHKIVACILHADVLVYNEAYIMLSNANRRLSLSALFDIDGCLLYGSGVLLYTSTYFDTRFYRVRIYDKYIGQF
jgi:hypothetical protein